MQRVIEREPSQLNGFDDPPASGGRRAYSSRRLKTIEPMGRPRLAGTGSSSYLRVSARSTKGRAQSH
jgi:hypothetical protein